VTNDSSFGLFNKNLSQEVQEKKSFERTEYMSPRWILVIGTTACLYLSAHTLIVPKQHVEGECGEERVICIPSAILPGGHDSYALANCDRRLVRKLYDERKRSFMDPTLKNGHTINQWSKNINQLRRPILRT
jgi:hypothetical protein